MAGGIDGRQPMGTVDAEVPDSGEEIRRGTRWLLAAFLVLTLLAVNQLFVLADVADRYWAWTISTEATAAFLGAAYGAGAVLSALSLRQDRWSAIRVPVLTVAVFTVLTLAATLIHTHRLHLLTGGPVARAVAWTWLGVYLVVPALCLLVVLGQEIRRGARPAALRPIPRWLTGLLAVEGALMGAAGVALFAGGLAVHHHVETVATFWPWEVTPLSAQVIGAWLLALGFAAALVVRARDLGRQFVAGVAYTVFGVLELVVVVWYRPLVEADDPWLWAYVGVLVAVVGTGAFGARAAWPGRAGPRDGRPPRGPAPLRSPGARAGGSSR
ncbi:hypothetical protein SAMN05660657_01118 [Geodermatophilus amargosae]|uniref:Uncharacterized protein n=1 Tax=Geodermatophilus amargosae TaxID=1296565 RepID=A0A1I6YIX1_9ACTN|nr:hypothetical protein [Geodermatophilus amargosae]SFT50456.1 hypothetical protein SAMN05660657_01118 [Geodermatophilus amargosae]